MHCYFSNICFWIFEFGVKRFIFFVRKCWAHGMQIRYLKTYLRPTAFCGDFVFPNVTGRTIRSAPTCGVWSVLTHLIYSIFTYFFSPPLSIYLLRFCYLCVYCLHSIRLHGVRRHEKMGIWQMERSLFKLEYCFFCWHFHSEIEVHDST